ncbi:MAG: transposase zinc-binding domain-containing protein [Myxococcota bacterium]
MAGQLAGAFGADLPPTVARPTEADGCSTTTRWFLVPLPRNPKRCIRTRELAREANASRRVPALNQAARVGRREPEKTVLYQAVAEHLPAFLTSAEKGDRTVPKLVRREVEGFLACGIIEKGAVRVRCPTCGFERLVACSCKSRSGLCSSCGARRMLDVSTHLCTNVIPDVPVRQWVITVPTWSASLCTQSSRTFAR